MNDCKVSESTTKKSLMNALENLELKAHRLKDLAILSDEVVDKLSNPRPQSKPTDEKRKINEECIIDKSVPDLIDLFNEVAEKIYVTTNIIGENIARIGSIIE